MDPPPFARANFFDGRKHQTARIYPAWTSEGVIGLLAMMESALFPLNSLITDPIPSRRSVRLSLQNAAAQGNSLLQIAVTDAASTSAME